MSPAQDQRSSPRLPTTLSGRIRKTGKGGPAEGQVWAVGNISVRGVFLETSLKLEVDETIEFDMELPGGKQVMQVVGIVRWVRDENPCGVGVEFKEIR